MREWSRFTLLIGTLSTVAACSGSQVPLGVSSRGFAPQHLPAARSFNVLHRFGSAGDGSNPTAGLISVDGTLFGTTTRGGAYGYGTVFSIAPNGKESVLHSFGGSDSGDGLQPQAGLVDVDGTLYGTTSGGGATNNGGTVFSITQSGTETVLHSFNFNGNGGAAPTAALTNVNGTLYGTTSAGGHGSGTVFSISTTGAFSVLHEFGNKRDGKTPQAALLDVKNRLYGTTEYGGRYGGGTVYTITTGGKEQVVLDFYYNGVLPIGGLVYKNGMLYGTTSQGGPYYSSGTIFSVYSTGSENLVHRFKGPDGRNPVAGLTNVNGVLYGTTLQGGANNLGTVFELTRDNNEIVLHSFGGQTGLSPYAGLLELNGTLYGTTYGGGKNAHGNVFSLTP
jgi:uncharacterized repeat protein (TIGR03803 family)